MDELLMGREMEIKGTHSCAMLTDDDYMLNGYPAYR